MTYVPPVSLLCSGHHRVMLGRIMTAMDTAQQNAEYLSLFAAT